MKCYDYDALTKIYKKIQEKNLSVYVETDSSKRYYVTCKDHHLVIHTFDSRQQAIDFCKYLGLNIIAYVSHKI